MPFNNFIPGNVYTNGEVLEGITKDGLSPQNPPAFTYNRWNKGMSGPQPYFEYLGRSQYRYLGEAKYNGPVFNDQKGGVERQIAEWTDGKYKFLDPKIDSFKQWKESDWEGIATVGVRSKLLLLMGKDEKKYVIKKTDQKNTFENGYKVISTKSPLAKELLGKKVGDQFSFGSLSVEVLKIS